jgi:hypothetical protein
MVVNQIQVCFWSLDTFLYVPTSGTIKNKHATKKRILPMKVKISLFFMPEARKKKAQIMKIIQPAN